MCFDFRIPLIFISCRVVNSLYSQWCGINRKKCSRTVKILNIMKPNRTDFQINFAMNSKPPSTIYINPVYVHCMQWFHRCAKYAIRFNLSSTLWQRTIPLKTKWNNARDICQAKLCSLVSTIHTYTLDILTNVSHRIILLS